MEDEDITDNSNLSYDAGESKMDFSLSGSNREKNSVDDNEDDDVVIQIHMDIKESLNNIKSILESQIEDIQDYKFTLQDSEELDGSTSLLDHCIQGEGLVQIELELRDGKDGKRINIIDVLRPTDDEEKLQEETQEKFGPGSRKQYTSSAEKVCIQELAASWVADEAFNRKQELLGIPQDPHLWTNDQVQQWLAYAVRRFNIKGIQLTRWDMDGAGLCSMTKTEFKRYVPIDKDDRLWIHFELLRRGGKFAIHPEMAKSQASKPKKYFNKQLPSAFPKIAAFPKTGKGGRKRKRKSDVKKAEEEPAISNPDDSLKPAQLLQLGNSQCQIQLWQFLLELLTDSKHRDSIKWVSEEGEFELINPDAVAQLWGARKNKPQMNFQGLSRSLRYYYDGDMISKVPGKKFVYKFICDLKYLIGYSAYELNALVMEAEEAMGEKITCSVDFKNEDDLAQGLSVAPDLIKSEEK